MIHKKIRQPIMIILCMLSMYCAALTAKTDQADWTETFIKPVTGYCLKTTAFITHTPDHITIRIHDADVDVVFSGKVIKMEVPHVDLSTEMSRSAFIAAIDQVDWGQV